MQRKDIQQYSQNAHCNATVEWYLEKRQDLEILEAFLMSLEVSFFHGLFLLFWVSKIFTKGSRARISNWDLGVSASLGFYHLPPLQVIHYSLAWKFSIFNFKFTCFTTILLSIKGWLHKEKILTWLFTFANNDNSNLL